MGGRPGDVPCDVYILRILIMYPMTLLHFCHVICGRMLKNVDLSCHGYCTSGRHGKLLLQGDVALFNSNNLFQTCFKFSGILYIYINI